jgi:peptide/nickel transport system substrate-binding protein
MRFWGESRALRTDPGTGRRRRRVVGAALALGLATAPVAAQPAHGIAMHGPLRHGADFRHFDYVNPAAPKGGTLRLAELGTFNSTNPLIIKGVPAPGVREHVFESLLTRGLDEPFSLYGLLARTVETPEDRSWVEFTLDERARFSDGRPVTVDDVVFSLETLRDHGRPNHRSYYAKVVKIERPGPNRVRFDFASGIDRELPLIIGLMPVLPRHRYGDGDFEATSLEAPLGSGPYVVDGIRPGETIVYRRNPDYWGRDLPVNVGKNNFEEIRYDHYRDRNSQFEAFAKGLADLRLEDEPVKWATAYRFPAVERGEVILEEIEAGVPSGMSALVFNTRRPLFADIRVRRALLGLFDAEWVNRTLYAGLYARTRSYFDGSVLSSHGRPADPLERRLLDRFPGAVLPEILDGSYRLPQGDAAGRNRDNRRRAIALLAEAGYVLREGRMVEAATGEPVGFEILVADRDQERLALNFARSAGTVGIGIAVRLVDSAQFQSRLQTYDYDMVPAFWFASLSPGNEQGFYWGSDGRATPGTRNYMGAASPAVDAMIAALLAAREGDEFTAAVRALDRVLLSETYVIPLFHLPRQWLARWRGVEHPERHSLYGYTLDAWWRVPE